MAACMSLPFISEKNRREKFSRKILRRKDKVVNLFFSFVSIFCFQISKIKFKNDCILGLFIDGIIFILYMDYIYN